MGGDDPCGRSRWPEGLSCAGTWGTIIEEEHARDSVWELGCRISCLQLVDQVSVSRLVPGGVISSAKVVAGKIIEKVCWR